jgi:aminoglycoside 6'-N-acetyltransferase I
MGIDIRILGPGDAQVLSNVAADVFDNPLDPELIREFLNDPRHHLAVAVDGGVVVGFASAVRYVHPDKPPELWINEVGVAPSHWRRGLGKSLLRALFELGRTQGCKAAWVLTERTNTAAIALYTSAGGKVPSQSTVYFEFGLDEESRCALSSHPSSARR